MVATDRVLEIFADARILQADALEMLAQGKFRNAAEKAWGAAKRATDALVLARTATNRSGRRRLRRSCGIWRAWTRRCGKPAWWPGITSGRGRSTVTASTWASAILWPTLSAGSERPLSTSMTLSAWRPAECT